MQISDLTLRTGETELVGLRPFDGVSVVARPLVDGMPPTLLLAGTSMDVPGWEHLLAWLRSVEDGVAVMDALGGALCNGVPVVDVRRRVRQPTSEEAAALEALRNQEQAPPPIDTTRARMTPEQAAAYVERRRGGDPARAAAGGQNP